ncbi:hypothetical protein [Streptomyces sp. NBRC 109706]|uniref:hypothetical protein n=1 Tax=Streptomyces sp. NBRC 109706 TaxID=1550035 RepID=UPI000784C00D|nr:hypothetical protein [Streptomyces sp. NBRC 109706]
MSLATELPAVGDALLGRYAELVCTHGDRVTEYLVHDEWETHHGEMPLALDQRPDEVQREIAAATVAVRRVSEWLRGLHGFFMPGRSYGHPTEGEFHVSHVAVPPPGWDSPGDGLGVAFGWRRILRDIPLAGTDHYRISIPSHHVEAYTTPDYYGWRPVQVTPVSGGAGGDA